MTTQKVNQAANQEATSYKDLKFFASELSDVLLVVHGDNAYPFSLASREDKVPYGIEKGDLSSYGHSSFKRASAEFPDLEDRTAHYHAVCENKLLSSFACSKVYAELYCGELNAIWVEFGDDVYPVACDDNYQIDSNLLSLIISSPGYMMPGDELPEGVIDITDEVKTTVLSGEYLVQPVQAILIEMGVIDA